MSEAVPTFDILYLSCPWHSRAVLFSETGQMLKLHWDDVERSIISETILLGIVRKVAPGLQAAFVDVGDVQDGFLPLQTVPEELQPLHEGQKILVRIVRHATQEKGPRLDARVPMDMENVAKSIQPPAILQEAPKALNRALRDAGLTPVRVWVQDESLKHTLLDDVPEDKLFLVKDTPEMSLMQHMEDQLAQVEDKIFPIPGGGRMSFEITRALTAVDVDSGASGLEHFNENKVLELNKNAARALVRLCELLNLGGNIVVDFITMPKRQHRKELSSVLQDEFSLHSYVSHVDVMKMSRYGLVEINRVRRGENLLENFKNPLFVAGGLLLQLPAHAQKTKQKKISVTAAAPVADILTARLQKSTTQAWLGKEVDIISEANWPVERFSVS